MASEKQERIKARRFKAGLNNPKIVKPRWYQRLWRWIKGRYIEIFG